MYVHPHNPDWAVEYEQEARALSGRYQGPLRLHHIGSTAIPGLWAKDCIDVLGVVPDLATMIGNQTNWADLGYEFRGEYGIKNRAYFVKTKRKAHLHIFAAGDPNIKKHLNFVETMRSNQNLRDELNALKLKLHNEHPLSKSAYQEGKAFFYDHINQTSH